LLIVKNYTGDRINFGTAAEMAKQEGIPVEMVIVADDCALPLGKGITGGRGLAGTVFVHKIAGARAATGASLAQVYESACMAALSIGTLGVALSTCTVPGTPASERLAQPGLIEFGMGIHGEPGREQVILPETGAADYITERLVAGILDQALAEADGLVPKRMPFSAGQRVAVLVNNLGALPVIEMQIVTKGVMQALRRRNLVPVRAYVGPFMTSLEMTGVSLTLFMLADGDRSKFPPTWWRCISNSIILTRCLSLNVTLAALEALDAETTAPAWVKSAHLEERMATFESHSVLPCKPVPPGATKGTTAGNGLAGDVKVVFTAVRRACSSVIAEATQLTAYDAICGDGDCGVVMRKGAEHVLQSLPAIESGAVFPSNVDHVDLAVLFNRLADALSASMGGTSGALLELGFRAMASAFLAAGTAGGGAGRLATQAEWAVALGVGVSIRYLY
jgi:dihydroxyacetone kinase